MRKTTTMLLGVVILLATVLPVHAQTAAPIVRGVLFWAEGCPACEEVRSTTLPALETQYGDRLEIQQIEISDKPDQEYFLALEQQYEVPAELRGVPALFIADSLLVGRQIEVEAARLIEERLAAGGSELPNLENLAMHLPSKPAESDACAPATPCVETASAPLTALRFSAAATSAPALPAATENNGFWLAWGVMALLIFSLVYALGAAFQSARGGAWPLPGPWADNLVPLLCLIGFGIAAYLTYVETQQVAAVCGPVGDCNAVQTSPYAKLFGVLPVGLLGMLSYVVIVALWALGRFGSGTLAALAPVAVFALALVAVLFSIYLTYLELFVILAVCVWCVGNAVVVSLIMIASVGPAVDALAPPIEAEA